MIVKTIKVTLFLFIVFIMQVSFLPGLFYPLNKLNIFLPVLIFFLVLYEEKVTMIYAIVFSVFLAISSSLPLILSIFVLPLAIAILVKIYNRFFTNKSIYSLLLLNLLLLLFYQIINTVFFLIYYFYNYKTFSAAINYNAILNSFIWQAVLSSVFVFIAFFFVNYLSNKLKTVFIDAT